jgi:hypothetical protein
MSDDDKKVVQAGRRRKDDIPDRKRERAEAPQRKREGEKPRPTASGVSGTSPPSGGVPRPTAGLPLSNLSNLGCNPILLIVGIGIVVVILVVIGPKLFSGGLPDLGDTGLDIPSDMESGPDISAQAAPTLRQDFTPPARTSEEQTWLVMLYQDADDKILEQDIYLDLNEAEHIGSTDRMHIVAQVDRFKGGFTGENNWTSVKRLYVTADDDLNRVGSQEIADLGEVNMADGETLVDFVVWAIETFPADRHVLILSDHGMGWPGGWSDPDPATAQDTSSPLASRVGNQLYLNELDAALGEIRERAGLERFEMIGMDACLMGHLEVFEALQPHARFAVASQETEPALGWAYTGFLEALAANPDMNGEDLGKLIVQSYITEDQRIVDDEARAEFIRQGSPLGGLFGSFTEPSADQLVRQMSDSITLTAVDLDALPELMDSVNQLAYSLQGADQRAVAQARTYAQSFTSIFGSDVPPSYIDLGSFIQLLVQEGRLDTQMTNQVLAALDQAVIAEKHGPKKPGATGVSVYFPNSQLYQNPVTGAESYTLIADRFAANSLWDDFLAFHYTGRNFDLGAAELVVPERSEDIAAPASGGISVSPMSLSGDTVAPGDAILMSADIQGENVGHVLLFVGYLDTSANSIFVADMDYLESPDTRQIKGVYYPDWGDGEEFTLQFEWEPIVFAINDGNNLVPALFTPERYGASQEEAVYTVDGYYTDGDDGTRRFARLHFSDGALQQVFGFSGEGSTGAPREILPQAGDSFTVLEKWMDRDENGQVINISYQEGDTVIFSGEAFAWEEMYAAPGEYIVGYLVQDLDGKVTPVYANITIE